MYVAVVSCTHMYMHAHVHVHVFLFVFSIVLVGRGGGGGVGNLYNLLLSSFSTFFSDYLKPNVVKGMSLVDVLDEI